MAARPLHVLAALAAVVAALPLVYLVVRTADAGLADVVEALWRERTLRLTVRSLGLALEAFVDAESCLLSHD